MQVSVTAAVAVAAKHVSCAFGGTKNAHATISGVFEVMHNYHSTTSLKHFNTSDC